MFNTQGAVNSTVIMADRSPSSGLLARCLAFHLLAHCLASSANGSLSIGKSLAITNSIKAPERTCSFLTKAISCFRVNFTLKKFCLYDRKFLFSKMNLSLRSLHIIQLNKRPRTHYYLHIKTYQFNNTVKF